MRPGNAARDQQRMLAPGKLLALGAGQIEVVERQRRGGHPG
jgi:hypothetical protein